MDAMIIKKKLIEEIKHHKDEEFLKQLYKYFIAEGEAQEFYKLSAEQNFAVQDAREQYKKGDFFTDDEVQKENNEWLKK